MRHYFDFPTEVRDAVEAHVQRALSQVDPARFRQEPAYVAAIAAKLVGEAYSGSAGHVRFESTIIDSSGRNSAESWAGADWAITAQISDGKTSIEKAILLQAKLGYVAELPEDDRDFLIGQVEKMKKLTRAPKVLEVPQVERVRLPTVISGDGLLNNRRVQAVPLDRYLSSRVLTTLHGDTRPDFVAAVKDSRLTELRMIAER